MSTTSTTPTAALSNAGVSIWLDDLSRQLLTSDGLKRMIEQHNVVGVTTNPSIFAAALTDSASYTPQLRRLAAAGVDAEAAIFQITTDDVRDACDLLSDTADATDGVDGRVSIEVDPRLAHNTQDTIAQAKQLHAAVNRRNVHIKIPATSEGLHAIANIVGSGISVNATLIFRLERYRSVIDAYMTGLERARAARIDLSGVHSVASFFVSRVDTEIDQRLDTIGSTQARALKGKAGVANARLAYQTYQEYLKSKRWQSLAADGARPQRPLWASTGVKDAAYPDTFYVTELVAPGVVNTMPENTLQATADHAHISPNTIQGTYDDARQHFAQLHQVGVSYQDVVNLLERQGLDKFVTSWQELLTTITQALHQATQDHRHVPV